MAAQDDPPGRERERDPRPVTERPLDGRDYSRRTLLALERTYLAWWRTGLTTLTVALAAARVVPELANAGTTWPYTVIGVVFAVLGILCVAVGEYRRQVVDRAIRRGEYVDFDPTLSLVMTVAVILVGIALILIMVIAP
jgi:putative membrane protein